MGKDAHTIIVCIIHATNLKIYCALITVSHVYPCLKVILMITCIVCSSSPPIFNDASICRLPYFIDWLYCHCWLIFHDWFTIGSAVSCKACITANSSVNNWLGRQEAAEICAWPQVIDFWYMTPGPPPTCWPWLLCRLWMHQLAAVHYYLFLRFALVSLTLCSAPGVVWRSWRDVEI